MTETTVLFPPSEPEKDFAKTNKLIYSFPKTGKTTLMSYFVDAAGRPPLFAMTEAGEGELRLRRARISSWAGFLMFVAHCEKNHLQLKAEHSSIVIDVISDLDDMAAAHVCERLKIRDLADLEFARGYNAHKKEAMYKLMALLPLSFIAHSGERELIWNGEKIKIQSPIMSKNALNFVNGKVDTIMWIQPATQKKEFPEIIVDNSMTCIAGSRYPSIVGRYKFDPADPGKAARDIEAAFNRGDRIAKTSVEIATTDTLVAAGTQPEMPTP